MTLQSTYCTNTVCYCFSQLVQRTMQKITEFNETNTSFTANIITISSSESHFTISHTCTKCYSR